MSSCGRIEEGESVNAGFDRYRGIVRGPPSILLDVAALEDRRGPRSARGSATPDAAMTSTSLAASTTSTSLSRPLTPSEIAALGPRELARHRAQVSAEHRVRVDRYLASQGLPPLPPPTHTLDRYLLEQSQGGTAPQYNDPFAGPGVCSLPVVLRAAGPNPPASTTRFVQRGPADVGWRENCETPLTEADLYLTDARPPPVDDFKYYQRCSICSGVKRHPVTLMCGHSYCYVCLRLWLERSWECPECRAIIRRKPLVHWSEAHSLEEEHPGDASQQHTNGETSCTGNNQGQRLPPCPAAARQPDTVQKIRKHFETRLDSGWQGPVKVTLRTPVPQRQYLLYRLREQVAEHADLAAEARARARETSKRYRQKHADVLAHRQRIARMNAFEKKHGPRAWLERANKLQQQREEAQELEDWRRYEEVYQRAAAAESLR
ncbi:hypothetical protein C8R43DRAFT_1118038 [Mycena crocata]|nr:hypothetical protein C8R43DRAFT_1118038 [Mycena crocata]